MKNFVELLCVCWCIILYESCTMWSFFRNFFFFISLLAIVHVRTIWTFPKVLDKNRVFLIISSVCYCNTKTEGSTTWFDSSGIDSLCCRINCNLLSLLFFLLFWFDACESVFDCAEHIYIQYMYIIQTDSPIHAMPCAIIYICEQFLVSFIEFLLIFFCLAI